MESVFHEGEIALQTQAGSLDVAMANSEMIQEVVHIGMTEFIQTREFVAVSSVSKDNKVWPSALFGLPGFIKQTSENELEIKSRVHPDDKLLRNAAQGSCPAGLLLINLSTRRRYRINGMITRVTPVAERQHNSAQMKLYTITFHIREAFFNCPKYIQKRLASAPTFGEISPAQSVNTSTQLSNEQQQWVSRADTFFLATYYPKRKAADISHRGGKPGFIRVLSSQQLVFPDFYGNGMFQSLGNILSFNGCGIIIVDFESGNTLQLSGSARIEFTSPDESLDHSDRMVYFTIDAVCETQKVLPFHYDIIEYSPYNYPLVREPPAVREKATSLNFLIDRAAEQQTVSGFPIKLVIARTHQESPTTRTFEFRTLLPDVSPVHYRPGQFGTFLVTLPGQDTPVVRTWTLTSSPDMKTGLAMKESNYSAWTIKITMKLKDTGLVSPIAIQSWSAGNISVSLAGIGGDFSIFPSVPTNLNQLDLDNINHKLQTNSKILALSGGVGITPMMSTVRALAQIDGGGVDVSFVSASSTPEDILFAQELAELSLRFTSPGSALKVILAVSRLSDQSKQQCWDRVGRIDRAFLQENVKDISERCVLLCGPPSFMQEMCKLLDQLGVPQNRVLQESFDF